jgi:arsenate reductase
MDKTKVLFVCIHNSARSQMAEAYLNKIAGDSFFAESAGIEPGVLNPLVVESLKEKGMDISRNKTKSVFDFYKQGRTFDYVITVCDKEAAERCPIFTGAANRIHWSFMDPSKFEGTKVEKLGQIAMVRDAIEKKIMEWIKEIKA